MLLRINQWLNQHQERFFSRTALLPACLVQDCLVSVMGHVPNQTICFYNPEHTRVLTNTFADLRYPLQDLPTLFDEISIDHKALSEVYWPQTTLQHFTH